MVDSFEMSYRLPLSNSDLVDVLRHVIVGRAALGQRTLAILKRAVVLKDGVVFTLH